MNIKYYLYRLKNPGTILAIASGVILLLPYVGVEINSEKLLNIIRTFCAIGIALGVLNNPDTDGIDIPGK